MQTVSNIDSQDFPIEVLLAEVERREAVRLQLDTARFDKQREFAADDSQFRVALCGRRAGKTVEVIHEFKDSLDTYPGDTNVFIEQSRPSAIAKLWKPFEALNDKHGWGLKFNLATADAPMTIEHPNGAILYIVGADQEKHINKIRGIQRLRLACVDECGQIKPSLLQYLVYEVLEPGLMDVGGRLILSGTPGIVPAGFWFEASSGNLPGWSIHHWTVYDNPFIDGERAIEELLKRRNWTRDNPIFQREYLGKWVRDLARLIFAYSDENRLQALPISIAEALRDGWSFILSIDYGTAASTAFVVLGYAPYGSNVYVFRSFKKSGLAPSEVADITKSLIDEFKPDKVIGDLHGLGKAYAQEMLRRHEIAIQAANKKNKRAVIEYVSDAFRTGQLFNHISNETLDQELKTLLWNDEHTDIADGQDDHETEALVYGFEQCPVYANDIAAPELPKHKEIPDGYPRRHEEEKPYWAMEEEW